MKGIANTAHATDQLIAQGRTGQALEITASFQEGIDALTHATALQNRTDEAFHKLILHNQTTVSNIRVQAQQVKKSSLMLMSVPVAVAIIGCVILTVALVNAISIPLDKLSRTANVLASGDVNANFDMVATTKDEIGIFIYHFTNLIKSSKEQAAMVEAMALGDLEVTVTLRSDKDVLSPGLRKLIDASLTQQGLLERLATGDFTVNIQPRSAKDRVNLAQQKLVQTLNSVLMEIQEAIVQTAAATEQISVGAQSVADGTQAQAQSLTNIASSLGGNRRYGCHECG